MVCRMMTEPEYERTRDSNTTVTYVKNQAQDKAPKTKLVMTVPLLHIKTKSRKYPGRIVTRGYYFNIPKTTVESMDLQEHELVEITIRKVK